MEVSDTFTHTKTINRKDGLSPNQFKGVHKKDIPIVEDLLLLKILLFDIDNVEGNIISELAWRSVQKHDNTVRLLRHKSHICYSNNAVFQIFRCPNCDTFLNRAPNSERHLNTCSERVKSVYPRNIYQIRATVFDKLDSFGNKYTSERKLLNNLAIFDTELICVQKERFKNTNTTIWLGKRFPISVFIYQTF